MIQRKANVKLEREGFKETLTVYEFLCIFSLNKVKNGNDLSKQTENMHLLETVAHYHSRELYGLSVDQCTKYNWILIHIKTIVFF